MSVTIKLFLHSTAGYWLLADADLVGEKNTTSSLADKPAEQNGVFMNASSFAIHGSKVQRSTHHGVYFNMVTISFADSAHIIFQLLPSH